MSNVQGKSKVPMILGIIGGVLGIPSAYCGGVCAGTADIIATGGASDGGDAMGTFMILGLLGAVLGLVGGIQAQKNPKRSGYLMIAGALMSGITVLGANMLALLPAILFAIGAYFSLKQETGGVS